MKNILFKNVSLLIFGFAILTSCQLNNLQNPHDSQPIFIAGDQSNDCKKTEKKQWLFLFGSIPINKISHEGILKEKGKSYKVKRSYEWSDLIFTLVLGSLLSITRESVLFETCEGKEEFRISRKASDLEIRKLKEELVKENKELLKAYREEVDGILSNRREQKQKEYEEAYFRSREEEISKKWIDFIAPAFDPKLYTVEYHDGSKVQGTLVELGSEFITMDMDGNRVLIMRKRIKRLVYPEK